MAVNINPAFNKVTAFHGLVWRFSCRFTDVLYIVTAETQTFNNQTTQFESHLLKLKCKVPCRNDVSKPPADDSSQRKRSQTEVQAHCKAIVKIITCQTIKNYKLGFRCPHVMVQVLQIYRSSKGKEVKCYHIDVLVASTVRLPETFCFQRISSFSCDADLSDHSSNFYLSDGPLCTFSDQSGTNLFYCCTNSPEVINIPFHKPILPYVHCNESLSSTRLPPSFKFISDKGHLVTDAAIDGTTQSMYFASNNFVDRNKICALCIPEHGCADTVPDLVVCMADEFIYFERGKLKHILELPLTKIHKLLCFQDSYYIVLSKCGKACAVDAREFKVVREWADVSEVLVDDFNGNGNQMLLLLHPPSRDTIEEILKGSVLTDVVSSQNLQETETKEKSTSRSKYLAIAHRGLAATLQAEKATLNKTKLQITQKAVFIESTITRLRSLFQSNVLVEPETQPVVVDIAPKKRILSPLAEVALVPKPESPITLQYATSRVVPGGWLLAVKLRNISLSNLCSFEVHLTPECHFALQYTTKQVILECQQPNPVDQKEDEPHNYHANLYSQQSTLLTAVVPMWQVLKMNLCGHISVGISFCCCEREPELFTESVDDKCKPLLYQTLGLIPVKLDPVNYMPENSTPASNADCIADLRENLCGSSGKGLLQIEEVACHCMSLLLVAPNGRSRHLPCMLQEAMGLVYDLEHGTMKWMPREFHTNPVWIRVGRPRTDAIAIKVYYWCENDLQIFLAILNDRLPRICVLPDDDDWTDLSSIITKSLGKELEPVFALSQKAKTITTAGTSSPMDTPNISDLRVAFAEQQKMLQESQHCTVSQSDYSSAQERRLNQEIVTDSLISSLIDKCYSRIK